MKQTNSQNLTTTKISTFAENATVSPPLTPSQRADLTRIRASLRELRNETEQWMGIADGLYRTLKELRRCQWLRLEPSTMSLPVDSEIIDDLLERVEKALSSYEQKLFSR